MGEICEAAGVPYLVDACQAVGQIPVDPARCAATTWPGPPASSCAARAGIGFLYVSDRALERGDYPLGLDMRGAERLGEDGFELADGARRFENWEFPYALVLGLGEAARYALEVGIESAGGLARELAAHARERLSALPGVSPGPRAGASARSSPRRSPAGTPTRDRPPAARAEHQHQRRRPARTARRCRCVAGLPPLLQHPRGGRHVGAMRSRLVVQEEAAHDRASRRSVRVRRVEGAPVVAVRLGSAAGGREEPIPGQALLTGRMLTEGTRRRDWRRIAERGREQGDGPVRATARSRAIGVSVDALARDWELALEWAAELLLESAFPEDRCAWLARQAAAELESLADQPDVKTVWGFHKQLYSPHPRSRPLHGSAESLLGLTPADCAELPPPGVRRTASSPRWPA